MSSNRGNTGNVRVLVAPLDWGLGHATRCIPIIREFLKLGAEVLIGAEGAIETLLRQEFPTLQIVSLKGYRVRYAKTASGFNGRMLAQLPRLVRMIRQEHYWLEKAIDQHGINLVISDNRYGLYSKKIPCIFITHQLAIRTGSSAGDLIARRMNYRFINRFNECWVPDYKDDRNLAGALSHPVHLPAVPVVYIGILSRLTRTETPAIPRHLFVSLSGPEPQRSLFEGKLVDQLSHYNHSATMVRGLPDAPRLLPSTNTLRFYNHLPTASVAIEMDRAAVVIARSGYSTIMDLVRMGKRAILVPTPGQTEQLYLAQWLMAKGIAYTVRQESFNLEDALAGAEKFYSSRGETHEYPADHDALKEAISHALATVQK